MAQASNLKSKFSIVPLERHKITNPNIGSVGYKIVDFIFSGECRLNLRPYRLIFLEAFKPWRKEVYCPHNLQCFN